MIDETNAKETTGGTQERQPALQETAPQQPQETPAEEYIPTTAAPLPDENAVREMERAKPRIDREKVQHWDRILTGDPAAIPDDIRTRAGADDTSRPQEQQEYELLTTVNRSWAADHLGICREKVRTAWRNIRDNLADAMDVGSDEHEVFEALSDRRATARQQETAQRAYREGYLNGLDGKPADETDADTADTSGLREEGRREGERERERLSPMLPDVVKALEAVQAAGEGGPEQLKTWCDIPELVRALGSLSALEQPERARVYRLAAAQLPPNKPHGLTRSAWQSFIRSGVNMEFGLVQAAGNVAAATGHSLARGLGLESLHEGAEHLDKRLQVLEEMRHVVQDELYPVEPPADSGLAGQMALDAAAALPQAGLAFCGGCGFGLLTGAGVGESIAEARRRNPKGSQELQTAAGLIGGSLQAGIYMGMGKLGANALSRTLDRFVRARGGSGYLWAGLRGLGDVSAESAKLLLAGKAAQAADLGVHELAARVEGTASNIDWQAFGDNLADIETNMREAAATLPYILLASGRVALRHFRSPRLVLGDGLVLREQWGLNDAQLARLENAPSVRERDSLLHTYLSTSTRWSAPGFFPEIMRAMRLLNTDYYRGFSKEDVVRDFLDLPSETASVRPKAEPLDTTDPAKMQEAHENVAPGKTLYGPGMRAEMLQLMDHWWQNAHFKPEAVLAQPGEPAPADAAEADSLRNLFYFRELSQEEDAVPRRMRRNGLYAPNAPEETAALMRDRAAEIVDLSYRYLLNSHSLDGLVKRYPSLKAARKATEEERRSLVADLCNTVMECAQGRTTARAFRDFVFDFAERYEQRAKQNNAPKWMSGIDHVRHHWMQPEDYRHGSIGYATPEPERQMLGIGLGLRSCAKTLYLLLPHTDDFQTAISRGCTVPQAYALMLRRELGEHLPEDWQGDLLGGIAEDSQPNPQNQEFYNLYEHMTGYGLSSATGKDGVQYWRIRRPDGRFTRWHEKPFQAVNDLVSNARLNFLPTGEDTVHLLLHGVRDALGDVPALVKNDKKSFTGFDQVCSVALEELGRRWMESASLYPAGLDVARVRHRLRGAGETDGISPLAAGTDAYGNTQIDRWSMATPLALAQARIGNYWRRMLGSRLVTPQQAVDFLVEQRVMLPNERDRILALAKEDPFGQYHIPRRRIDNSRMNNALADALTNYSTAYMLARMDSMPLPQSMRTWMALIPFCEPESIRTRPESEGGSRLRAAIGKGGVELIRWANRRTAAKVKGMLPVIEMVENATLKPFDSPQMNRMLEMVRESIHPTERQRLEQAWCHRFGGDAAFRSTSQEYRNLLEHPAEAWDTVLPETKWELAHAVYHPGEPAGNRGNSVQAVLEHPDVVQLQRDLQQLDAVLRDFPELRGYALNPEHPDQVDHLQLHAEPADVQEPLLRRNKLHELGPVHADYTVERNTGLPEEWRADARVLPALQTLTRLRAAAGNRAYADQHGIWWKHRLYGGANGNRPEGITRTWRAEAPFDDALSFLEDYDGSDTSPMCAHLLKPLHAPLLPELMQPITLYCNPAQPDNIYRLMPGELEAANPRARTPYIIHTYRGAPTVHGKLAYAAEQADDAYQPLDGFSAARRREFGSNRQDVLHDRLLLDLVLDLLGRAESVESLEAGRMGSPTNRELLMRLGVDTRFCASMSSLVPSEMTRGQGCAAAIVRGLMGMEFSQDPAPYAADLVELAKEIDGDVSLRHDLIDALQTTSGRYGEHRVVHRPRRKSPRRRRGRIPTREEAENSLKHEEIMERLLGGMMGNYNFMNIPSLHKEPTREEITAERARKWAVKHGLEKEEEEDDTQ
ncbi:MAG: hypothetical protein Q4C88_07915 [Akkermansia sp.]|nr:hypothetical protein [Akkermansia sp.]